MATSTLQFNSKSKILSNGYINVYTNLTKQEKRQVHYKTSYKKSHPEWDESLVFLTKKFKEKIPNNCAVLDAGCGKGNYVIDENRDRISWATGVDVSKESLEKNICLDEKIIADLENLPFTDNTFDCVTSLFVLEHIKNPHKVFSEIHRVLKPEGIFMFVTPNKHFLLIMLSRLIKSVKVNDLVNKTLYGRKEKDIFKTYYSANTLNDIKKLSSKFFKIIELKYNFDPAYTSFNKISFYLTTALHKLLSKACLTITYPHILGIMEKQS